MSALTSAQLTPQVGKSLDQAIALFRQGRPEEAKALFKTQLPKLVRGKIYHKIWETQRPLDNSRWGRMVFYDREFRKLNSEEKISGIEDYLFEELEPLLKRVAQAFRNGAGEQALSLFSEVENLSSKMKENVYDSLKKMAEKRVDHPLFGQIAFQDLTGRWATGFEKADAIERLIEERNHRSTFQTLYDHIRGESSILAQNESAEHRLVLYADWVPTLYAAPIDPKEKPIEIAFLHHCIKPSFEVREEMEKVVRKVNNLEFKKAILNILKVELKDGLFHFDIKIDPEGLHWYVKLPNQAQWISVPKTIFSFMPTESSSSFTRQGQLLDLSIRKLLFHRLKDKEGFLDKYCHRYKKKYLDEYAASDLFKQQRKRDKLNRQLIEEWRIKDQVYAKYALKIPLIILKSFANMLRGLENEDREQRILEARREPDRYVKPIPYEENVIYFSHPQLKKTFPRYKWKRMNESAFIHPYAIRPLA